MAAAEDEHIRKPTDFDDSQDATDDPEDAFAFPESYDESVWSTTTEPDLDPSVTWHTWNLTDQRVYEELSLTITVNASGFDTDDWNFYYVDTTEMACNSDEANFLTGTEESLLSDNTGVTNATVSLARDQDLSLLEVCLSGSTNAPPDGGEVSTFDIRTNGTVDDTPPQWRNQQQNVSTIVQGEPVELAAEGYDNVNLSHATLATNETGSWENKSVYGSPETLYTEEEWTWSNFTWSNASVSAGSTVGWRVWYNDTAGNSNVTDTETFSLEPPYLDVSLHEPPGETSTAQNETFTVNASAVCRRGDCGAVDGTARYNASGTEPDTDILEFDGEPFHTVEDLNPQDCASDLLRDEECRVTWEVNATGDIGSTWLVDANLSSDLSTVAANDTRDVEVEIMQTVIDLDMAWDTIDFGSVFVGTGNNSAVGNDGETYGISVGDTTTVDVDIWMNASDLHHVDRDSTIGVSNMTWNATVDDPTHTQPLSHPLQPVRSGVAPGSTIDLFYWLNMPSGIFSGDYTGTLWVTANETA